MEPSLGVCYYPEHWPESQWKNDAKQMHEMGLSWVLFWVRQRQRRPDG